MPNPFTQYTGEQVPQINILPYTAGIANSLQQGMSDLGKGLGQAIQAYKGNQEDRDAISMLGAHEISSWTVPEMEHGDDSQENYEGPTPTGQTLIKENAPAHIKALFDKAKREAGEGQDWTAGLANLDTKTLKSFYVVNQQHKQDEETKFNQTLAGRQVSLREREAESNILLQRQQLEKATRENLIAQQISDVNKIKVNESVTIDNVREQKNGVAFKVRTPWAKADPRWKDQPQGDEGALPLGYDEKTIMSADVDSGLKAFGIKKEDLAEEQTPVGNILPNAIAKIIGTGGKDAVIDTNELDATKNKTTYKAKFMGEVAEALMSSHPELRDAYKQAFFLDKNNMMNRTPVMSARGWQVALKSFQQDPAVMQYLSKKHGVTQNGLIAQSVAQNGMSIVDQRSLGSTTIRTPEIHKIPPVQQLKDKFTQYRETMNSKGLPVVISENDWFLSQGINLNIMQPMYNESGQLTGYANSNGTNVMSRSEYNGLNSTASIKAPKNQTESRQIAGNNWYEKYASTGIDKKTGLPNGGVEAGNSIITFPVNNPNNPMADNQMMDTEKGQKEWSTAQQDLQSIDSLIDQLQAMQKEASLVVKTDYFNWTDFNQRYNSIAGQIEGRYRKYFIGTGTETEPDYKRLAMRTARPQFSMNSKTAIEILEDTRQAVKTGAVAIIKSYGGKIYDKNTKEEVSSNFAPKSAVWKEAISTPVKVAMDKEAEKRK